METRIVLSRPDLLWLRALLTAHGRAVLADREHLLDLQEEMDRAAIVEADLLPADVVAVDSTVTVLDLGSSVQSQYTVVLPAQADVAEGRVSVLAPLGTALLGYRVGDVVQWRMPGGLRRLRIEAVQHPKRSGDEPTARRKLAA